MTTRVTSLRPVTPPAASARIPQNALRVPPGRYAPPSSSSESSEDMITLETIIRDKPEPKIVREFLRAQLAD